MSKCLGPAAVHTPLRVDSVSAGLVPPPGRRAPPHSGPGRSTELWLLLEKCIINFSLINMTLATAYESSVQTHHQLPVTVCEIQI